ncbi:MAG: YcaQ family DNA glycosylase, partial [Chloroflexi bacterium]|nr:YcaQ family DNA glycosylase [Chloroflexota bacterium]
MPNTLSLPEARRLAIVSQAFGRRPRTATIGHVRRLAEQIHAFQIDSVNVLVRAHYMPAFARLGPYPMEVLDNLTYQRREFFEYWGHAACLLPMRLFPLVRYRMHSDVTRDYLASERGAYANQVYREVAERGPLTAGELSEPGKRSGNWWGWASGKAALEHLYDAGLLAIARRRGFEREYDLVERVIPSAVLEVSVPREEAMKQLICLAAQAYGVGTFQDITGYFNTDGWRDRLGPGPHWERSAADPALRAKPMGRRLVAELVEEGRLLPAQVEGWLEPAYLHPAARVPRAVHARALVTPFDSLVWERRRIERLFGMKYTIELYTPLPKRVYGYYVCPFLLGETLVARCDLKADRQRGVLMVRGAFLEPGQRAGEVADGLWAELQEMRAWLRLEAIEVAEHGDLAAG